MHLRNTSSTLSPVIALVSKNDNSVKETRAETKMEEEEEKRDKKRWKEGGRLKGKEGER